MLVDELQYGRKGETEVIIAGGAAHAARPPTWSSLLRQVAPG
jgi:hypothetical protein